MVGTFLEEGSDGFRVPATRRPPEKVANMVGTYLTNDRSSFQIVR
ncbi:hypothetical protein [Emticicia sp. C21]|nr:hypothetical protein [Emticicia sp. C21]